MSGTSDPTDVEGLLEEIREELHRRTGLFPGSAGEACWSNDRAQKAQHAAPPRIEWVELGGDVDLESTNFTGGHDGDIGIDAIRFQATIWAANKRGCRKLRNELMRSTQNVVEGPNCLFGRYEWLADANAALGRKMVFALTLRLPIPFDVARGDTTGDFELAELQSYATTVQTTVAVNNQAPTP